MRPDITTLGANDPAWAEPRAKLEEAARRLAERDPRWETGEATAYYRDDWTGDTALMVFERELESRHDVGPGCGFWMLDSADVLSLEAESPYRLSAKVLLLSCPDRELPEDWQEWAYEYDLDLASDGGVMLRVLRCGRVDGAAMDALVAREVVA